MRYRLNIFLFILLTWLPAVAYSQHLERNTLELGLGMGKRAYVNSKKGVMRGTASLNYNIRLNRFWDLKLGGDAIYWDIKYKGGNFYDSGYLLSASNYEHWAYAVTVGSDFKMGRLIFTNSVGRYLYFKHLEAYNIQYYTKVGFRYLITRNLTAGVFLRAHSYEADYMDFGISFKL